MITNLIKYLIFTIIICFYTCVEEEKKSPILDISFNISIPLQSFPLLQTVGNAVYFNTFNGQVLGYRNHGIYVIKIDSENYRSFDATCSYYPEVSTHVLLLKNGYECPTCKSLFELFTGSVIKNPAQYPLKNYTASLSNQNIHVYN